jgi:transcription antitermination factor NusG
MTVAVDVKRLSEISARVEAARLEAEFGLTNRARALLAGCGETEPQRPWFVLRVADGRENDVENLLQAAGVECWIPSLEVKPRRRARYGARRPETVVRVPVWPGYLFAKVVRTDRAWAALARVEGIDGALPTAEHPAPIPDAIVLKLKLKLEHDEGARAVLEERLKVGQAVRVDDGPLATFNGVVRALCGHDRLKVDVSMFGRVVTVDLGLDQVSDCA